MDELIHKLAFWLAYRLPRKVVYYAVIRAVVHATTGKWSPMEAPALTITDMLERWTES